jgi:replicative DNA helicase
MNPLDISPLTRVVTRLDRVREGEADPSLLATGFPSLDRAIGGGFRRGELVVLGGDDGVGCSAFALAIALRTTARTVVLTSEMQPERAYERALAMTARVSLEDMRLGHLDDAQRAQLAAAAITLRDHAPVVDTLRHGSTEEVAEATAAPPSPDLMVVDGLEALLAPAATGSPSRAEALANAVMSLKRLAVSRNAAVLVLSHLPELDRHRADRRPRLTDFGACGAVGTHADLVLGLYREDLYDADMGVAGATELRLLKFRDGALGYVDLYFYAKWLRFEDVLES